MATFEWSCIVGTPRHLVRHLSDTDATRLRCLPSEDRTQRIAHLDPPLVPLRGRRRCGGAGGAGRTAVGLSMGLAMRCCSMLDVFIMAIVCILKVICADVEGGGSLRVE